jgi:deazaflavin-dependent oxidoreductase (nitroreductase family)
VVFERLADESVCYLTTTGRVTGKKHTIEIWFALRDGTLYILSGGGDGADWVRNIRKDPRVRIRLRSRTEAGRGRILRSGTKEDLLARQLLDGKYMGWREGKPLSSWARGSRPVAVEFDGR